MPIAAEFPMKMYALPATRTNSVGYLGLNHSGIVEIHPEKWGISCRTAILAE
jgi:hypothetical protein